MGNFQYLNVSTWTDIPDAAHPADEGSVQVVWPEAAERDGAGNPCGAWGLPKIVIQSPLMRGDGWQWWQQRFSSETVLYTTISITAYNSRRLAWVKYAGTLLRPLSQVTPGGSVNSTLHADVTIVVEKISEIVS